MVSTLAKLLDQAIRTSVSDLEANWMKVGIAFSGGLDSSVLATVAKKYAEVELFTAGVAGSQDLEAAQMIANELSLPLFKTIIDQKLAIETYREVHKLLPLDRLKIEILIPVHLVAEAASKQKPKHNLMLFGAAAEELFVGYKRYFDYLDEGKDLERILHEEYTNLPNRELAWISKICSRFDIEARAPFYNQRLADHMFSTSLAERIADCKLRKCLLRNAAREFKVPEQAVNRKKKAMQYGSGVHKLISRHTDKLTAFSHKS